MKQGNIVLQYHTLYWVYNTSSGNVGDSFCVEHKVNNDIHKAPYGNNNRQTDYTIYNKTSRVFCFIFIPARGYITYNAPKKKYGSNEDQKHNNAIEATGEGTQNAF